MDNKIDLNCLVPTIRLAILTYNRANFLPTMLKSVQDQNVVHFQVRVFDNCSTDETRLLLSEFCAKDARFTFVSHQHNIGAWQNLAEAKKWGESAEYYAMLHDDDQLDQNWLLKSLEVMKTDSGIALVGTNARFLINGTLNSRLTRYFRKQGAVVFTSHVEFLKWFCRNGSLVFPSILYRSEFTKQIQFPSHARTGDIIWYLNVAAKGRVGVCFEPLMNYRIHSEQDSAAMTEQDYDALELFCHDHANVVVPELKSLLKSWLAWQRLAHLRNRFKGCSRIKFIMLFIRECKEGKLVVFSRINRYYLSVAMGLFGKFRIK